jgi:hypothetical protein
MANALNATLAKRSRNGAVLAGSVAAAMAAMALWNTYRARKVSESIHLVGGSLLSTVSDFTTSRGAVEGLSSFSMAMSLPPRISN